MKLTFLLADISLDGCLIEGIHILGKQDCHLYSYHKKCISYLKPLKVIALEILVKGIRSQIAVIQLHVRFTLNFRCN